MNKAAKTKIDIATSRIVVREPFFGTILLGMPVYENPGIETAATNGLCVMYNPDFINTLDDEETVGLLCHEVMHVAKLHPWRRQTRDPEAWNVATDYVINQELTDARFTLPKGGLLDAQYKGMAEEQVYAKLPKSQQGGGGGGNGKGNGKPGNNPAQGQSGAGNSPVKTPGGFGQVMDCPGTEAEKSAAEQNAKVEILRAAQVAKQQGKLPAGMESLIEEIKHPKVSWQEVLRNCLTEFAKDDYSWTRPNARYADTGFVLPSLKSERCGTIAIAIDTSGSIGATEFAQFMGEVREILSTMKPSKTIILQCDAAIADYQTFESGEFLPEKFKCKGGGGTAFEPVFQKLEAEGEEPLALVYLTDAYGSFPDHAPSYPVIWAVTSEAPTPWGERIEIDFNN